jgi:SAM-dependent methyltransferase
MSSHYRSLKSFRRLARRTVEGIKYWPKERGFPRHRGYCVVCERQTTFVEHGPWLRDQYQCRYCHTVPRNRALVVAVNRFFPNWPAAAVHESSGGGNVSRYLRERCAQYSTSHYFDDVARGEYRDGDRSEDLSRMTFADASFDLFITQDVFEHVIEPAEAFREIARVLRPGGMHIFSMPWYPQLERSVQRARLNASGDIEYLLEPMYHLNPIDPNGSLVTYDWGVDFTDFIRRASGMNTVVYVERDRQKGIDAEFLEIFVSRKGGANSSPSA